MIKFGSVLRRTGAEVAYRTGHGIDLEVPPVKKFRLYQACSALAAIAALAIASGAGYKF